MRKLLFILLFIPFISFGQKDYFNELVYADSLIQNNQIELAYSQLKNIEKTIPKSDSLYDYTKIYLIDVISYLENNSRLNEDFSKSLEYGLETLDLLKKENKRFNKEFAERKPYMIKNIAVSYSGLKDYKKAKKYKDLLYKAYKHKTLPEGINEYFNFDFFKLDDKNIWGYEWFEELPKDRFSTSFTKIVYYVYSTNPDGSDKDQLYRLHILMFHGNNENFDYVMDKRFETETEEIEGTMYSFIYKEDIDFEKLHNDVIQIVKKDIQPDTKRVRLKDSQNSKIEIEL